MEGNPPTRDNSPSYKQGLTLLAVSYSQILAKKFSLFDSLSEKRC